MVAHPGHPGTHPSPPQEPSKHLFLHHPPGDGRNGVHGHSDPRDHEEDGEDAPSGGEGVDLLVSHGGQGQDHHVGRVQEGPALDDHVPDYPGARQDQDRADGPHNGAAGQPLPHPLLRPPRAARYGPLPASTIGHEAKRCHVGAGPIASGVDRGRGAVVGWNRRAGRRDVPGSSRGCRGGVAEWTMAAVLKTANRLRWFVGSNPTPSARIVP